VLFVVARPRVGASGVGAARGTLLMLSLLCRPRIYIVGAVVAPGRSGRGLVRGYVAAGERILAELTNDVRQCAAAFAAGRTGAIGGELSPMWARRSTRP